MLEKLLMSDEVLCLFPLWVLVGMILIGTVSVILQELFGND